MNTTTALTILSQATEPQAAGRLSRANYVEIEQALGFLKQQGEATARLEAEIKRQAATLATLEAEAKKLRDELAEPPTAVVLATTAPGAKG
jgi:Skp family chaperone for outer membrane proteins